MTGWHMVFVRTSAARFSQRIHNYLVIPLKSFPLVQLHGDLYGGSVGRWTGRGFVLKHVRSGAGS